MAKRKAGKWRKIPKGAKRVRPIVDEEDNFGFEFAETEDDAPVDDDKKKEKRKSSTLGSLVREFVSGESDNDDKDEEDEN